ncbi:MAG: hypothetical protein RL689_1596 [Planctomycetota bacterium]
MNRLLVCTALVFTSSVASWSEAQSCGDWQQVAGQNLPPSRWLLAMAHHADNGTTVMFSGQLLADWAERNDTWIYDGASWRQALVAGPSKRSGSTMAYDERRGRTVLFGGSVQPIVGDGRRDFYNDTWEWDGASWRQVASGGPPPRMGAAIAYDPIRQRIVLAGGVIYNGSWTALSDCWGWDGVSWVELPSLPRAVGYAPMAFDAARGRLVLFSGTCGQYCGLNGETLELGPAGWVVAATGGPIARANHFMAYSPELGGTALFGGTFGNPSGEMNDTWLWRDGAWSQLQLPTVPPRREAGGMVYDSTRRRLFIFGGGLNSPPTLLQDQWELVAPPRLEIVSQPVNQSAAVDAPVSFLVQVQAGNDCVVPVTYQWQRRDPLVLDADSPGAWIDLQDGSQFVNTRTGGLIIAHPIPALATGYRCRIGGGCGCRPEARYIYSDVVNFDIACPADFNADGGVDFSDVETFFLRWETGC